MYTRGMTFSPLPTYSRRPSSSWGGPVTKYLACSLAPAFTHRSRHTPFHTVKVVILGQDPYHNHNQAHGLAFSVRPPPPAPPSLKIMYKALKNDYPTFGPPQNNTNQHTPKTNHGVLLLNTCLTVRAHE